MRFIAIILIAVLLFFLQGQASPSPTLRSYAIPYVIPFGMAEYASSGDANLSKVMPRSKNLTQMQRLDWSEKCRPFRHRCSIAEHCCSMKCLVHLQRCNA